MTKAYLVTRCVLDNQVNHHQKDHNSLVIFLKYLNYACKIKSVTICLVRNSIQISKPKHPVTSRFI